jgi:hypothetical protein
MSLMAKVLKDEDIDDLAAWFFDRDPGGSPEVSVRLAGVAAGGATGARIRSSEHMDAARAKIARTSIQGYPPENS